MTDTNGESETRIVESFGGGGQLFAGGPLDRLADTADENRDGRYSATADGGASEDTHTTAEKATDSQQADTDAHTGAEYYSPPRDPRKLLLVLEQSETAYRCTTAISQGVAGTGFSLVPADPEDDSEPPGRETVTALWHDGDFQLGPDEIVATPEAVLEHVYHDRVGCGYGTLEILLNDATYTPTGAAHVPAHTIRRRRNDPGYVQLDNGRPDTYYGPAGGRENNIYVDVNDGTVARSAAGVDELANELLVTNEYAALAPHYGVPPIVPALRTVSADVEAAEYQYRFFENDGVPRFVVIVEGGQLTERAWEQLTEKLKDLKGTEDAHRGIVVEATPAATLGPDDDPVNVRIEPLTVGEQEDAGFIDYRKENEHNIAQAFNVPPVVRGRTENVNYASAREQRRQFAQEELKPRQDQFAAHLTKVIHETMLDVDGWALEFNLSGGDDRLREAETANTRASASAGTDTVDERRGELGHEPLGGAVGEMMVAELGGSGGGGVPGGEDETGGGTEDQQEQARAERHTERLIEIGERAEADG